MRIRDYDIGVCSWSLQPADAADLVAKVKQLELEHLQLGVGSLLAMEPAACAQYVETIRRSGLTITATSVSFPGEDYTSIATIRSTGGLVADEHWPVRKDLVIRAGKFTAQLGVKQLELHVGFVPASNDPSYQPLVQRVRGVAEELARDGVSLLLETGQESASELLQFLNDMNSRNVAVNFDPANMILYGAGDPIAAVAVLNRHIRHVHVKDAIASNQPRVQWGAEVRFGTGQVVPAAFLDALDDIGYSGPLVVEREAGEDRAADIRAAIKVLNDLE